MRYLDITGQRYGSLVAVRYAKERSAGQGIWECKCDCGATHFATCSMLRVGTVRSCGCSRATHGHTRHGKRSPTFKSWESMRGRCENEKDPSYRLYGGRGIRVCPQWSDFATFLADMGERPQGTSLDRIDVDKNYSPENCRWATRSEQQRNRRDSRKITANGETLNIQEWAARLKTDPQAIAWRLRKGMSAEEAVTKPIRIKRK